MTGVLTSEKRSRKRGKALRSNLKRTTKMMSASLNKKSTLREDSRELIVMLFPGRSFKNSGEEK